MTAVTRPHRFFSHRNRRRGARAGLVAIAVQLLLMLGQALPARAQGVDDESGALGAKFVCVVYQTGTAPSGLNVTAPSGLGATAPGGVRTVAPGRANLPASPDGNRPGPGGHNACPVCIVSGTCATALPATTQPIMPPPPMMRAFLPRGGDIHIRTAVPGGHPARAPPFVL